MYCVLYLVFSFSRDRVCRQRSPAAWGSPMPCWNMDRCMPTAACATDATAARRAALAGSWRGGAGIQKRRSEPAVGEAGGPADDASHGGRVDAEHGHRKARQHADGGGERGRRSQTRGFGVEKAEGPGKRGGGAAAHQSPPLLATTPRAVLEPPTPPFFRSRRSSRSTSSS